MFAVWMASRMLLNRMFVAMGLLPMCLGSLLVFCTRSAAAMAGGAPLAVAPPVALPLGAALPHPPPPTAGSLCVVARAANAGMDLPPGNQVRQSPLSKPKHKVGWQIGLVLVTPPLFEPSSH